MHPSDRFNAKISDTAPNVSRWLGGGLQQAEVSVKAILDKFYISKIVWVPKQSGWCVNKGEDEEMEGL